MGIMDILQQAMSGNQVSGQHFDQVAENVPNNVLASGLAGAFRSDETPPIGQMVGQLFANSNPQQQAGMLNRLLGAVGGAGAASSLGGGVLGRVMSPNANEITPEQASQLSPQEVQQVVEHAHQQNPDIADHLGSFYSQHSGLVKTLGGAALAIALAKMKDHMGQA
jgi:hypothetical protein